MPAELIRAVGAVPSYYLHYYYLTGRVLEEQRTSRTRAEEVMEIEAGLLELYKDPTLDTKPKLLEERGGAFYSDAAAALVASLHAGTEDVQVVNVRNGGAIPNLPDDAVVEVAATVDRDGAHPLPVEPLAPEMLALVEHAKAYELLAVEAAITGDRGRGVEGAHDEPARGRLRPGRADARRTARAEPRVPPEVLPRGMSATRSTTRRYAWPCTGTSRRRDARPSRRSSPSVWAWPGP